MVTDRTWNKIETTEQVSLGRQTSAGFVSDPKRLAFVLARYKFVAKMIDGATHALEVGCGDGFGAILIAQVVDHLTGIDLSQMTLSNATNHPILAEKCDFQAHDILQGPPRERVYDAAFSLDVIEHIPADLEDKFYKNTVDALADKSMFIIGTPNKTAEKYQSEWSMSDHINLKTQSELHDDMKTYFDYVLVFGMNDEVVHTGFADMAHYIFAIGLNPKRND